MNKRRLKGNATRPCGILPPALWRSLLTVVLLLCIQTMQGGSASWSTTPASGDWNTASNWVPMTIPDGGADTATFGQSNVTVVSLSANTEVNGIVFNADAIGFRITTNPVFTLTVSGVGITNNGTIPAFVNNADLSGRGEISFFNNATAGGFFVNYYNNDTPSAQMTGGRTSFFGNSTAGEASFRNRGNAVGGGLGGRTFFNDFSTAGQGRFTNKGGVSEQGGGGTFFVGSSSADNGDFFNEGGVGVFAGGFVQFLENSTAGNASIYSGGTVEGEDVGGTTLFAENSSAGSAILTTSGPGAAGGEIYFLDDSTGGTARVSVNGLGKLDLSFHNAPGVTIGSLEGNGNVFLGARNLTVAGVDNLNPESFSGVIQDGGLNGGVGGSLTKIGPGRLALSGANTYTGPTTINAGKLSVDGSITSAVTVNNGGTLGGIGTVSGTVIVKAEATLSGGDATTASGSLTVGNNLTLNSNSVIELGLGASGAHSTLNRTGGTWTFASNQAFAFFNVGPSPGTYDNVITGLAGDPGGTAAWTITTPGFAGSFTYDGAGNIDLAITAAPSPTPASQAINLSTRMRVQAGDNAGIGGFIITGTAPKHLLLRAIGPFLAQFGISNALADPVMELHDPGGFATITNDNWMDDPVQAAAILATGLAPINNLESAIDTTLNPGAYTAVIRGKNNTSGIGLIEVYDLSHAVLAKLANISTRAFVGTANDIVIAGFVLGNNSGNDRIVVRGIGPSLTAVGVGNSLANPTLELLDSNGALLVGNNDWQDDPAQAAELTAAGLAPTNNLESALVATLPPGLYTALLAGLNNGIGNGLVEVYDLGRP